MTLAAKIRPKFRKARVMPQLDGSGREYSIGGLADRKRTDVSVWDDAAGLIAGISIKTYTFRDTHENRRTGERRVGRYVRNVRRNDMELRDEADTLHRRQPYAVLTAILFLPEDACWDGARGQSSFAHIVLTLRKRTGRSGPETRFDLFEAVYIGLFNDVGDVRFFDVRQAPRRNQPPADCDTITLDQLINLIHEAIAFRNTGIHRDQRYAADDPAWTAPVDSLPAGIEQEEPLILDDVLQYLDGDLPSAETSTDQLD